MRIVLENVKKHTVITNAQVKAMHGAASTRIDLLPNPGTGFAWNVRQVVIQSVAGTAAAGGSIRVRHTGLNGDLVAAAAASGFMPTNGQTTVVQGASAPLGFARGVQMSASAAITAATSGLEVIAVANKIAL